MKILEKGTKILPHEVVYVKRCRNCGCKFTYTKNNMINTHYGYDDTYILICPQCHYSNSVPLFKRRYKGEKDE